jgi:hypothetical protein
LLYHKNVEFKTVVMISVNKIDNATFEVTVKDRSKTVHRVTVPHEYYRKLSANRVTPEVLVEKSFEFLLEREPNTSILRSFELSVIGSYFPEYERIIKEMIL